MGLTVRENLRLGQGSSELAFQHFPELERRSGLKAGLLSGGEQQMLSLARIIAARPRIILADELSLGLAPIVVKRLLTELRSQAEQGCGVLLVEQHVKVALEVVDRAYFLKRGEIALSGDAATIKGDPERLQQVYL
jgi:branched-chain amino acid transport system ATP-binding protein